MSGFNLSEWALRNRALVTYFTVALALIGVWSYARLGQSEDPPFAFKAMVVRTLWPGATAAEVSEQVTERIETKLLETGAYEFIRGYSRPGESQVFFVARDSRALSLCRRCLPTSRPATKVNRLNPHENRVSAVSFSLNKRKRRPIAMTTNAATRNTSVQGSNFASQPREWTCPKSQPKTKESSAGAKTRTSLIPWFGLPRNRIVAHARATTPSRFTNVERSRLSISCSRQLLGYRISQSQIYS